MKIDVIVRHNQSSRPIHTSKQIHTESLKMTLANGYGFQSGNRGLVTLRKYTNTTSCGSIQAFVQRLLQLDKHILYAAFMATLIGITQH